MNFRPSTVVLLVLLGGCAQRQAAGPPPTPSPPAEIPTEPATPKAPSDMEAQPKQKSGFESMLAFLKQHAEVEVLEAENGARIVVSPTYQGRVMTSAVSEQGDSLGWVNQKFIESTKTGTQFDNYGGEDRFWLGPEAGQFGLYFPKGKPFEFSHWQAPAAFQEGAWKVVERARGRIAFERSMTLDNYQGTRFDLSVKREISLLDPATVASHVGAPIPEGLQWVAYQSRNEVLNRGKRAWSRKEGLISIWILAMFPPAADSWVIVPFMRSTKTPLSAIVNDEYFGKVPGERLIVDEKLGAIFFRCDGRLRSKIGLAYGRAKPVLGSYSRSTHQLTLVMYDLPKQPAPYVNSMWQHQKQPFRGDVINSYNDGPTEPGKPALGGFYELETSSPGAELGPGGSIVHHHRTFHFVGEEEALETVAKAALGVSLSTVPEPK